METESNRDPYKLVGTNLKRYLIQELAGTGGLGAVYRAQHQITRTIVAVKVLRPDLALGDQEGLSYFFEEAAKAVALNHPAIILVKEADLTTDGWAFVVMEWLNGQTLDQELKEHGVFSLERAVMVFERICDGLGYAHGKNIVHGDLKPSNIMLIREENGEETVRILDFGIAKALSTDFAINTRRGSSSYVSPEQAIASVSLDQSSDIYSLGVILYQMFTGRLPFDRDTESQVMDMNRRLAPRPLHEFRPDISPAVEDVVMRAMAKRPIDRYQSAADLARALRKAARICPNCNTRAPLVVKFCIECGVQLVEELETTVNSKEKETSGDFGPDSTSDAPLLQATEDMTAPAGDAVNFQPVDPTNWPELHTAPPVVKSRRYLKIGLMIGIAMVALWILVLLRWQEESVEPATYFVEIVTSIPNSKIIIDDNVVKTTNDQGRASIEGLLNGSHTVRISKPGYKEIAQTIKVPLTEPLKPFPLERIVPEGMVYIPGGRVTIGNGDANKANAAGPAHEVKLAPFFIDRFEVTRSEYLNFIRATNRRAPAGWKNQTFPPNSGQWPVTGVSWEDAREYCSWAGSRLPAEEEWELAARGSDGRLFPWGNTFTPDRANLAKENGGQFSPVGSFPNGISPFGVYDLAGNAWEWTESDFKSYPGSPYRVTGCRRCKVLRGGAYVNLPEYATAAYRQPYEASLIAAPNEYYGFRCARTVGGP